MPTITGERHKSGHADLLKAISIGFVAGGLVEIFF